MKPITTKQFLSLLPIVQDQDWTINLAGRIRNTKGECPICAIVNTVMDPPHRRGTSFAQSLEDVELEVVDAWRIVYAADHQDYGTVSTLRQQLLDTLQPRLV